MYDVKCDYYAESEYMLDEMKANWPTYSFLFSIYSQPFVVSEINPVETIIFQGFGTEGRDKVSTTNLINLDVLQFCSSK